MKFLAICLDTFREIRDKKMVLLFAIITAIFACSYIFLITVTPAENGKIEVEFFEDTEIVDAAFFVKQHMMVFSQFTTGVLIFLFIIAFAFVMANLLKPGTLDLHLSKPLWRSQLLIYKFFACVVNVFALMLSMCGLIWLILTWKAGVVTFEPFIFVMIIPIIFAISFSIITLCCVLTRGAGAGISIYLIYAYVLQNMLQGREGIKELVNREWFSQIIDALYHILPKINESIYLFVDITKNRDINWYPLQSSIAFMVGALVISCVIFHRRDY